ncbi:hypothetical protein C0J52_11197 [Blattella germanica]|nr:hypothetical protein C0J52_11197 [Blattella germanica]
MFSAISSFNKHCCRCILENVRNYSRTSTHIQQRRGRNTRERWNPNPGIQNRLNNLDPDDRQVAETNDFEDMESDFMGVEEMDRMYERETIEHKQRVQLKMVGQKYFKSPHGPSLLTWAEKEQIKHLHQSDPDKWNIEKLAQSFPATEEIVKKILKSNWHPSEATRILKHDQTVAKNWELLRNGKLEIDPHLKQHLMQFTDRKMNVQNVPDLVFEEKWQPRPTKNEFGSIIESYKRMKAKNTETELKKLEVVQQNNKPRGETYVIGGEESYSPHGRVTLEKYRERVQTAVDRGNDPSDGTKLMLKQRGTNSHGNEYAVTELKDIDVSRSSVPSTDSQSSNEKGMLVSEYPPERIKVPKKTWNRRTTYKLGDSYYDYDGSFLYRVPGLK